MWFDLNRTHSELGQNVSSGSDSDPHDALKPENIIDPLEVLEVKETSGNTGCYRMLPVDRDTDRNTIYNDLTIRSDLCVILHSRV